MMREVLAIKRQGPPEAAELPEAEQAATKWIAHKSSGCFAKAAPSPPSAAAAVSALKP
jgi:hypothetical protein